MCTPMRDKRYMPRAMIPVPATTKTLYRPHLEISRPEVIDVNRRPARRGRSRRPDIVGLTPRTTWRYSGRKMIAPNITAPVMIDRAEDTENTLLRNRRKGITGSGARSSTRRRR